MNETRYTKYLIQVMFIKWYGSSGMVVLEIWMKLSHAALRIILETFYAMKLPLQNRTGPCNVSNGITLLPTGSWIK